MTTAGDDVVSEEDGIVAMSLPDSKKLVPQDVTHLPSAPASWLSLGSLQQKGWTFDFIKGSMSLGSHPLQMYNVGPRGRLQKGKLHAICLPLVLPERKVVKTVPLKIADSSESEFKMEDCEVCAIAKATRLTFGNVSVPGKVPLEIVHSDIAGPLKPAENGDVYYITYIDDFTEYLFAYSLPDKTALGVLNSFKFFQAMVERAFSCKIQVLRTDGGGEYKDIMGQYLRQAGIVQQVTTPYTPQRNGRAERMNRTIKEILASMLIDAKIGMRYWNYGLKHALVLWNTGRVFDGVTLEERGHKRRVDYSKIQPFGAECWVRIPPENRRKADLTVPKAWKGKLLSIYFPGSGYIVLLDGDAEELIFSRDVPKLERPMQNSIIT
ncbi:hypothetical protein NliqN6_0002 [Naganishia liquefaciens]|uniref:Integrase catalytic domain-containing protein n=1 Tax=Naganishia liquefaciens TaxID=104408 RepID=A0A8H3TM32_9TREE|nr:hypothetical protein NliqN6_0002 [Naganishia liquefaciens]